MYKRKKRVPLPKNDKKLVNSWCMYDWANSVYSLTVATAILPPYFSAMTGGREGMLYGLKNSSVYAYIISAAFLLVALANPILSAIADSGNNKRSFMRFFCVLGSLSCMSLYFFDELTIWVGVVFSGLAAVGFCGSLVFYNAFLPEITTVDRFDAVSAKGFSLGYLGSVLLLVVNLIMVQVVFPDSTMGPKLCFVTVGIWWFGFAQITFNNLHEERQKHALAGVVSKGLNAFKSVLTEIKQDKRITRFLCAFFIYSMGTQTVMYMATIYGGEVVGMDMSELIILVLILQLVAIGGSYFFAWVSKKKGNIMAIISTISLWIVICVAAYFVQEGMKATFYIIGGLVGVVMGGIQSLSRSTYAKFIPEETPMTSSYFSFYETLEKVSIAIGAFVFGFISDVTGSMQNSALALTVFFVVALFILLKLRKVAL